MNISHGDRDVRCFSSCCRDKWSDGERGKYLEGKPDDGSHTKIGRYSLTVQKEQFWKEQPKRKGIHGDTDSWF
jgi:hypothetical protein